MTRSYSKSGHYEPAAPRSNYHLLASHKVKELEINENLSVRGVKVQARYGIGNEFGENEVFKVRAKREVVLAAGAFGSPTLLQRSGVGARALLEKAGVKVKVELPGVGENLQGAYFFLSLWAFTSC